MTVIVQKADFEALFHDLICGPPLQRGLSMRAGVSMLWPRTWCAGEKYSPLSICLGVLRF